MTHANLISAARAAPAPSNNGSATAEEVAPLKPADEEGARTITYVDLNGETKTLSFEVKARGDILTAKTTDLVTIPLPRGRRLRLRRDHAIWGVIGFLLMILTVVLLLVWLLPPVARTRRYYLAIDEVEWDYINGAANNTCTGEAWGYPETKYVERKAGARIGSTYTKASPY